MDDDKDEKPITLRVVTLLDVQPGRADVAETGEQVSLVTFAWRNEIEQPLLLTLKDTKTLAIGLFEVLSHHGDEKASQLLERYVDDKGFT